MAEYVQKSIEDTLEELEQLERVELFSGTEIKAIVRKRTANEYCLNRVKKEKEDFLKYIQYEMNLLALIKKRRERQQYFFKKEEIEHAIVTRVEKMFQRACTHFPEDLKLWLSYVQFARKWKRHVHLSQSFSKALRIHQNNPGLWILAAKYQFEDNNSSEHARRLMLKALRHHEYNQKVWLEYFRLELLVAAKLHRRMTLLQQGQQEMDKDEESLLTGNLAKVVYKNAIQTLPDDISFRLKFTAICKDYEFAEPLVEEIYQDLVKDHPEKPLTWNALARRPLNLIDAASSDLEILNQEEKCYRIFDDAIQQLSDSEMWNLYCDACYERVLLPASPAVSSKRASHCLEVFDAASVAHALDEDQFLKWVEVLMKTEDLAKAKKVTEKASTTHPQSVPLWTKRMEIVINQVTSTNDADQYKDEVCEVFDAAITNVKSKQSLQLWDLGYKWCLVHDKDRLKSLFEAGIEEDRDVAVPLKEKYLDYVAETDGLKKARKLYKRLCHQPVSLDFFKKYISLESAATSPNLDKIRGVFEDAMKIFGSSEPELWLECIKMELSLNVKSPERINSLHWKARKGLRSDLVEQFVNSYTLLQLKY